MYAKKPIVIFDIRIAKIIIKGSNIHEKTYAQNKTNENKSIAQHSHGSTFIFFLEI